VNLDYLPAIFAVSLFVGMAACLELGRVIGRRWRTRTGQDVPQGVSAVDGALFALLGLLIAFTFSGAVTHFEARRDLIREEANNIGTAYLRLDLLPPARQEDIRAAFRAYLEARLEVYRDVGDTAAVTAAMKRVEDLQYEIWTKSVAAAAELPGPQATNLLLPALNEMIDISTTRTVATQNHPPPVIYAMLALLVLSASVHVGFGMSGNIRPSLIHTLGFALAISLTVYLIMDIEYPRFGLVRIDNADQILRDVGKAMAPRGNP
jgi:hypothetical protein